MLLDAKEGFTAPLQHKRFIMVARHDATFVRAAKAGQVFKNSHVRRLLRLKRQAVARLAITQEAHGFVYGTHGCGACIG